MDFVSEDSPRSAVGTTYPGDVRDALFGSQVTTHHDDGLSHHSLTLSAGLPRRRQSEMHDHA